MSPPVPHVLPVTWESSTGQVVLYDNGLPMWTVTRGRGKRIPSGGTLVIGREQVSHGAGHARSGLKLAGLSDMFHNVTISLTCYHATASIPHAACCAPPGAQDCMGGCFDSAAGAAGRTSEVEDQEYGPQVRGVCTGPGEVKGGSADEQKAPARCRQPHT
jgi:hypothetical protein